MISIVGIWAAELVTKKAPASRGRSMAELRATGTAAPGRESAEVVFDSFPSCLQKMLEESA